MTIIIIICNSYQVLHGKEHLAVILAINSKTILSNILTKLQQTSWKVCNVSIILQ